MSKEYKIAQDQLWSSKVANYTKELPDTGKTLNRSPTKPGTSFVFRNYPEVTGFQTKSKASVCSADLNGMQCGLAFSSLVLSERNGNRWHYFPVTPMLFQEPLDFPQVSRDVKLEVTGFSNLFMKGVCLEDYMLNLSR